MESPFSSAQCCVNSSGNALVPVALLGTCRVSMHSWSGNHPPNPDDISSVLLSRMWAGGARPKSWILECFRSPSPREAWCCVNVSSDVTTKGKNPRCWEGSDGKNDPSDSDRNHFKRRRSRCSIIPFQGGVGKNVSLHFLFIY